MAANDASHVHNGRQGDDSFEATILFSLLSNVVGIDDVFGRPIFSWAIFTDGAEE